MDRRLALWLAGGDSGGSDATSCVGGTSQHVLSLEELRSTAGALQWSLEAQEAVWTSQITRQLTEFLHKSLAQEKVPQGRPAPTCALCALREGRGVGHVYCRSHRCDVVVLKVLQRAVLYELRSFVLSAALSSSAACAFTI